MPHRLPETGIVQHGKPSGVNVLTTEGTRATHFPNVDLDIYSRRDFDALHRVALSNT
jgi:hypothetical protein